jgi:DNA mismatch endonuclease (patch repair protein)
MADVYSKEKRSAIMAKIGPRDSEPELAVRRFLRAHGIGYRLHGKGLPGTPDLVLRGRRVVIFVHGCFWHRHPGCRYATHPGPRPEFWQAKFAGNVERDARKSAELEAAGWRVLVVWECATKPEQLAWLIPALGGE